MVPLTSASTSLCDFCKYRNVRQQDSVLCNVCHTNISAAIHAWEAVHYLHPVEREKARQDAKRRARAHTPVI